MVVVVSDFPLLHTTRFGQTITIEEISAAKGLGLERVLQWMYDTKRGHPPLPITVTKDIQQSSLSNSNAGSAASPHNSSSTSSNVVEPSNISSSSSSGSTSNKFGTITLTDAEILNDLNVKR